MLIQIEQPMKVIWNCPSNSMINRTVAAQLDSHILKIESDVVPQIGEYIDIEEENKRYKVLLVIRKISLINKTETFRVITQDQTISIDYYDYMKTFTHAYDRMKADSDPTRDLSKINDPIIWPSTWKEWVRRKEQLEEKRKEA